MSLPPDALATALARDSEIEVPAKLRSDEIALFKIVGGETMLAMLSRDFGSETLLTTSETLLSIAGMLPANFTALDLEHGVVEQDRSEIALPERGRSRVFGVEEPSKGWRQSCW